MTNEAVMVRGLRKAYGDRVVVDDLDLEVGPGEVVGLIGSNGAGKTTTVECLLGLRRPDRGHLRVLGCDPVTERDELVPLLGVQLQDSALPDRMRVAEAVDLFARRRRRGGADQRSLLVRFGLATKTRSPFAGLSGGEKQRLFLVLALLNQPRLVILDELTQGLDPGARREVWAAVGELRSAGMAVLLVTHELADVEALCDRVVAMRDGRVLDSGPPAALVTRHAGTATISWGATAGPLTPRPTLDAVARLDSVAEVTTDGGRVVVTGTRRAIAEIGAVLVGAGAAPEDLDVRIPDLETALLHLLRNEGVAA